MTAPLTTDSWDPAPDPLTRRGVLILRTKQQRERRVLILACAIAGGIFLVAVTLWSVLGGTAEGPPSADGAGAAVGRMTLPAAVAESAIIYDTAVMPLAPEDASAINAERPVDIAKVIPASALRIAAESAKGVGFAAALRCLTQAVYYEAASERDEGQSAVAQVVLNRLRHPAFPNTVCGVVYQGSERVTGCQFSFTCDGSLARVPSIAGWARAERAARQALGGKVAASVGNATHYHANYVVPYWAPTLDKAATIGAHIFYIMRGFLGSPRAFSDKYDVALEVSPGAELLATDALESGTPDALITGSLDNAPALGPKFGAPVEDSRVGNLIPGASEPQFEWNEPAALRADEQRGELKASGMGGLRADDRKSSATPPETPAGPEAS